MTRRSVSVVFLFATQFIAGCASAPQARDIWSSGLSRCTSNDTLDTKTLVFLGPSNTYGPGSLWRVAPDGVLEPRWTLEEAVPAQVKREGLVTRGADADCKVLKESDWKIDPSLVLTAVATPIQGKLGIDVSSKNTVDVQVKTWRLDRLNELAYEAWAKAPASGTYGQDALRDDRDPRRVIKSAVLVRGFKASVKLDATDSANLDVRIPVHQSVNVEAGLVVSRTDHDTLEINSAADFYVVASFVPIRAGGLGAMEAEGTNLLGKTLVFSKQPAVRLQKSAQ